MIIILSYYYNILISIPFNKSDEKTKNNNVWVVLVCVTIDDINIKEQI